MRVERYHFLCKREGETERVNEFSDSRNVNRQGSKQKNISSPDGSDWPGEVIDDID